MQQTEPIVTAAGTRNTWNGVERRRVEKVVETLATLRSRGDSVAEVAHDARNMVTALGLYCDLLEEPGVLASPFTHYAHELRLVAASSRRLVEKLVALDAHAVPEVSFAEDIPSEISVPSTGVGAAARAERNRRWDPLPALPITNLAAELLANRNLLSALAGPSVALTMEAEGGAQAAGLTGEDLTRLLVNLVKNAAEAMPRGGRVHIGLRGRATGEGAAPCLALTIEDNGPGIPDADLDRIFNSGYTSRGKAEAMAGGWPQSHRGLGLAIVRSIVEGAGGRITASNRAQGGACFTLELPVRKTGIVAASGGNGASGASQCDASLGAKS